MKPSRNIAIFDLDYTLTRKGTWGRFIASTIKKRPHLWIPIAYAMAKHQYLYLRGKAPRCGVKCAMMRLSLLNWSRSRVQAAALEFTKNEVENGLRPGALEAIKAHKAAGDTLMVASAAVDFIVEPICAHLGIEHYVATKTIWDGEALQDQVIVENCYGPEKLRHTMAYLEHKLDIKQSQSQITMYSDSYSDLEFMLWADKAVAVNPDRKLSALAKLHNIPVVLWN